MRIYLLSASSSALQLFFHRSSKILPIVQFQDEGVLDGIFKGMYYIFFIYLGRFSGP